MISKTIILAVLMMVSMMSSVIAIGIIENQTPINFMTSAWQSTTHKLISHKANRKSGIDISKLSLLEICKTFKISTQNCSCTLLMMKPLCDFLNITTVSIKFKCDSVSNTGIAIANIISSVLGLLGNGLVIVFAFMNRKDSSRFRHLISGLALADFAFAAVLFLMSVPQTWTCKWVYGLNMCKLLRASLAGTANIAVGFIVIIAIDRFFVIMLPFSKLLSANRLRFIIYLNVLVGIGSVIPPLVVLQEGEFTTCVEVWSKDKSRIYTWSLFVLYYVLPIVSLAVLYGVIMVRLKRSYQDNNILRDKQLKSRYRNNKNVMMIFVSILVLFAILVLPNRIYWIINDQYNLNNIKNAQIIRFLKMFSDIPYGLHAAVNPIIYSVVDIKFKQQLKVFFCGKKFANFSIYSRKTIISTILTNS
ncbi:apelin receptor A-like [Hydra vulgaris]|uniref:Apelin receptor A-like n=1 Tax=Hydra vulgaris TaxID=6087 RepID=A0ABM4DLB2_HYDVU